MKLFEAAKLHVLIMRFMCGLNLAFNLTKPKMSPDLFGMMLHGKVLLT